MVNYLGINYKTQQTKVNYEKYTLFNPWRWNGSLWSSY